MPKTGNTSEAFNLTTGNSVLFTVNWVGEWMVLRGWGKGWSHNTVHVCAQGVGQWVELQYCARVCSGGGARGGATILCMCVLRGWGNGWSYNTVHVCAQGVGQGVEPQYCACVCSGGGTRGGAAIVVCSATPGHAVESRKWEAFVLWHLIDMSYGVLT